VVNDYEGDGKIQLSVLRWVVKVMMMMLGDSDSEDRRPLLNVNAQALMCFITTFNLKLQHESLQSHRHPNLPVIVV
jgi:hypothetical protein